MREIAYFIAVLFSFSGAFFSIKAWHLMQKYKGKASRMALARQFLNEHAMKHVLLGIQATALAYALLMASLSLNVFIQNIWLSYFNTVLTVLIPLILTYALYTYWHVVSNAEK